MLRGVLCISRGCNDGNYLGHNYVLVGVTLFGTGLTHLSVSVILFL